MAKVNSNFKKILRYLLNKHEEGQRVRVMQIEKELGIPTGRQYVWFLQKNGKIKKNREGKAVFVELNPKAIPYIKEWVKT